MSNPPSAIRSMTVSAEKRRSFSFAEYLSQLPPELIFTHLLCGKKRIRKIVSASAVKEIAEQFLHPDSILERFAALPPHTKCACALAYLCGSSGYKNASIEGFQDRLLNSFLAYAATSGDGGLRYIGFDEFAETLKAPCAKLLARRAEIGENASGHAALPWACLNDLAVVCGLAAAGMLRLTRNGAFSKQSTTCLERLLHATHVCVPGSSVAWSSLLLKYGISQGFLLLRDTGYCENHGAIMRWLAASPQQRHADFVEFAAAYTGGWRVAQMTELLATTASWMSVDRFPEPARPLLCNALCVLAYAGMARLRPQEGGFAFAHGHLAWDAPAKPHPSTHAVILPDFSVIIPQETRPETLYWFLRLGSLASLDRIYRGSIDRKVINDSLCQGIRAEELIARLEEWRAPENVVVTVKEWIREFSRLSLSEETILISADAKVTQQLMELPAIQQHLEPIDAHRVFRVRPFARHLVEETLFGLGFDPRTPRLAADSDWAKPDMLSENPAEYPQPVIRFASPPNKTTVHLKSGKYSSEMKALDVNGMLHVIEYAILMNCSIKLRYRGSPGIRAGEYRIRPLSIERGPAPAVIAETGVGSARRSFLLKEIEKAGVEEV